VGVGDSVVVVDSAAGGSVVVVDSEAGEGKKSGSDRKRARMFRLIQIVLTLR
jgi:hypothetical protein